MIKHKTIILLIIIFALGVSIRLFKIQESPPSLNWDEAALGYNSYSLMLTGKDEYGHKLPLLLRSFDDYKPPVYSYLSIPFIYVFGPNELSVRLLSVIAGSLSIIMVYLLAKEIFSEKTALLSALLFSLEPWSVHFSRMALEAAVALPITIFGIYLAFLARRKSNKKYLYLSIIVFIASSYAYFANRALFPPLILLAILMNKNLVKGYREYIKISSLVILFSLPLLYLMSLGGGLARFDSTSIFRILQNQTGSLFSITNNSAFFLMRNVAARFFAYLSPANLFVRGTPEPNQRIVGFAVFYAIEIVFFLVGSYYLLKNYKKYFSFLLFIIILILPATLTWNWFSPVRVLVYLAMLSIVMGYGINKLVYLLKKQRVFVRVSVTVIILVIFLNNISNLFTALYLYRPYAEKGNWQFGFREIMTEIKPYYNNYDQVVFETGHSQPHIFTLFYLNYDPSQYHKDIVCPDCVEEPRKNFDFGKFIFRKIYWPDDRGNLHNTLFIGNDFNLPPHDIESTPNAKVIKYVKDVHGDNVAKIVELK